MCEGFVVVVSERCENGHREGGGSRTRDLTGVPVYTSHTETPQMWAKTKHINALPHAVCQPLLPKPALPEPAHDRSVCQQYAPCVPHPLSDALRSAVAAWEHLPDAVKAGILAMVQAVPRQCIHGVLRCVTALQQRSLLVRGRMPAGSDPVHAPEHGEVAVHMSCDNCRPSTSHAPEHLRTIRTPWEVAPPLLSAGVQQSDPPTCVGIPAMRLLTLGAVTQRTGKPEVVLGVTPAPGTGDTMLHVERCVDILLMCAAVITPIACLLHKTCP
jgi:hypothetical protein